MTTVVEAMTDAYREIGTLAQNESLTAFQSQQGLVRLKNMVASWELDGISMGDASDWIMTTELPFPENHTEAITMNLAVRLAGPTGRGLKEVTIALAQKGYRALQAAYGTLIDMDIDGALKGRRRRLSGDRVY